MASIPDRLIPRFELKLLRNEDQPSIDIVTWHTPSGNKDHPFENWFGAQGAAPTILGAMVTRLGWRNRPANFFHVPPELIEMLRLPEDEVANVALLPTFYGRELVPKLDADPRLHLLEALQEETLLHFFTVTQRVDLDIWGIAPAVASTFGESLFFRPWQDTRRARLAAFLAGYDGLDYGDKPIATSAWSDDLE
jgi:hypothetical protein